jgi:hypothetical protein
LKVKLNSTKFFDKKIIGITWFRAAHDNELDGAVDANLPRIMQTQLPGSLPSIKFYNLGQLIQWFITLYTH